MQTQTIDEKIISLLQERKPYSMDLLYDNYSNALFGVISRIVGEESEAEDVMQEAFMKIWRYGERYDASKGRLFTWILNIARNTAIDHLRAKKRKPKIQVDDFSVFNITTDDKGAGDSGLQKLVKNLDPKYLAIIDLVYFKGFTQSEIAKELDLPIGTVKSRLRIAIRELRNMMTEKDKELWAIFFVLSDFLTFWK